VTLSCLLACSQRDKGFAECSRLFAGNARTVQIEEKPPGVVERQSMFYLSQAFPRPVCTVHYKTGRIGASHTSTVWPGRCRRETRMLVVSADIAQVYGSHCLHGGTLLVRCRYDRDYQHSERKRRSPGSIPSATTLSEK
jgi:hypothetical protein